MALFFSGAVTSSPVKRRLRNSHCESLDVSLLSPDSSYICYTSAHGSEPCCCRRSPRLLTNGYYDVTEDSFSWDDEGNVSLTPCKTSVSYKENLHRVFRRRRRPRSSLVRLLSDVTESCQSWLDEKVFRGVFGTVNNWNQKQEVDQDHDLDWSRSSPDGPACLDESWSPLNSTELEESRAFTYDSTEVMTPPDKEAPPPNLLIHEEICSEICQSKERFTQSLGSLSEVPPPSPFYTNTCCCQASPEPTGFTMKALLLLVFIFTALYSGNGVIFLCGSADVFKDRCFAVVERDCHVDRLHDDHNMYAPDKVGPAGRVEEGEDGGHHVEKRVRKRVWRT